VVIAASSQRPGVDCGFDHERGDEGDVDIDAFRGHSSLLYY
jgi:hypothetical protein